MEQTTAAREAGLGLVLSLNVLRGNARGPLTAEQLRAWGTLLAREPSACALLLWRYDEGYFRQPEVRSALAEVAGIAHERTAPACAREP